MFFLLFQLFLIVLTVLLCLYFLDVLLTGKTPLVTTPKDVLEKITAEFTVNETSIFYDLGSGNGSALLAFAKKYPKAKFIGIDNSWVSSLLAKIRFMFYKSPNVSLVFNNFFNVDLSNATHIYSWIFVSDMDKLLVKLRNELKPGTYLYSLDFQFTDLSPIKVTELGKSRMFGHTLYTYRF